jgi:hypothetical protein
VDKYCEWIIYTIRNNLDKPGVSNEAPAVAHHCTSVTSKGRRYNFSRPGKGVEVSFGAEGFTAKIGGEFVDHWTKIRYPNCMRVPGLQSSLELVELLVQVLLDIRPIGGAQLDVGSLAASHELLVERVEGLDLVIRTRVDARIVALRAIGVIEFLAGGAIGRKCRRG